ncbi:SpoIID/LytB domain-containing protein [Cohnella lupini]|uniref:Stage II sporulation protein D n=1 Tax=Cohnella lupini TaxID=1294267 RepID=A0A3D9IR19_9BACL|nr:SpoIID/LytB domain-containing protein [Cohnella lupini]RED64137.1 stage II sporulation protein D [Cohnella lupini]
MILNARSSYSRLLLMVVLITVIVSGSSRAIVHAAVNVPDNIRVAFFINLGANKYQSLTSVATLQSTDGMNLIWRDPQFSLPAGNVAAGNSVRFAVDGYRALVLETADLNAAIAVLKKIQASSSAAFVTRLTKSGKPVYQVTEGTYSSAAGAKTALTKWTGSGVATGVQTLISARVAGPWAVETGPYSSAYEAEIAADQLGSAGLDSFVALKPREGALEYVLRVGQEQNESTLPALQEAVAAAGGLNVRIPAAGESYALIRHDMTLNGNANKPVDFYAIPAGSGAVLRADPAGAGGINLLERSKRTYRGSMEVSVLNQSLAVVNEVDYEQYLYSVVGTEIGAKWPLEAQKAQAVAARSYALSSGMGYNIAHVVDTTLSQAYFGIASENAMAIEGVNQTAGEVLTSQGKVINAVFSANAGGITADNATEIWEGDDSFLTAGAESPDDGPQKGLLDWYYVALSSGQAGYIRSDLLADSGQKHISGAKYLKATAEGIAVRSKPQVVASVEPIARIGSGTLVVELDKVPENTDYSWIEGPVTPEVLLASINKRAKPQITGPLRTLEVTKTGPSGRATEVKANGVTVDVGVSDNLRGALNGLKSTLFTIEETGRYSILNGQGDQVDSSGQIGSLKIIGGDGTASSVTDPNLYVMDGKGNLRAGTTAPAFNFLGKGYGHGLGMSQWGARGLAEQGYDYQYILKYYYKNVLIEKDA